MAVIRKELRDKLSAQAINEIQFARNYKQGKIGEWKKNEDMYYAKKFKSKDARANVELARMQEFVHTILSKIDNPLTFKYIKRKEAQVKRVAMLNSLREYEKGQDNWDIKDIVGKKQVIIYGRAIYSYSASSDDGYKSNLQNIDVYDFLIDPSVGGIDMEKASYMGNYNIIKTKAELEQGVKDKLYIKDVVKLLVQSGGTANEKSQEETNKQSRVFAQNTTTEKEQANKDRYEFWQWVNTFEGKRYYLLMDNNGNVIRAELLEDMFASNLWPYWSYAAFMDLTEFWTPSYCDYAREIFMAQATTINQMLDNAEAINKPQKIVDTGAIENLSQLKYRRNGLIKVKAGADASKAIKFVVTPELQTPLVVYDKLDLIQAKSSGITDGAAGVADEDGRVGIYEGNQRNAADRFGLLNKSYAFGYDRFAKLFKHGVDEHLIKKIAIDIIGPNGIEIKNVSRRDIFRKNDKFGILVEASNADHLISLQEKKTKITFLQANQGTEVQNEEKAYEMMAKIAGFDTEEIRELQDTDNFGTSDIMSEAERDIEKLLDGEEVKPNRVANNAYKQRFVTYMADHEEDMNDKQFRALSDYLLGLEKIINSNEARRLQQEVSQEATAAAESLNPKELENVLPTPPKADTEPVPIVP